MIYSNFEQVMILLIFTKIFLNTPPQVREWISWSPNLCNVTNWSFPKAFVKTFADWKHVGSYEGLITSACSFSRTIWQSISICFVCLWKTGLAVICKAAWLSQNNGAWAVYGVFKSCSIKSNQVSSKHVLAIARYSTSANDLETLACFLDFYEMSEFPRKT